jgi:hypothetical protein
VTEWAKADAVFDPVEVGGAVPLADVAGLAAVLEAAGGALELELELQAAAPATRQAPTAATRHLEPVLIRRDIPVKRTIAPLPPLCGEQSRFRPLLCTLWLAPQAYRIDRPINLSSR